jgi:hypothetical protein
MKGGRLKGGRATKEKMVHLVAEEREKRKYIHIHSYAGRTKAYIVLDLKKQLKL